MRFTCCLAFQFQYGAIERANPTELDAGAYDFNSSMVRLKDHALSVKDFLDAFQFQYGAIESLRA